MEFNHGKAYHGSDAVTRGKLIGKTGLTDYFFFLCPKCSGGQIMRILEHECESREVTQSAKRQEKKTPMEYFNIAFHLYCPNCQFEDFIKIGNDHPAGPLNPD